MIPLIFALLAQSAAATPPQADITVSARTAKRTELARAYVDSVAPDVAREEAIARFTDPICVGSGGLPRAAAQTIVDRVSAVADAVGLKTGEPGCTPNVMILFVDNGRDAVQHLLDRGSPSLRGQTLADVRRIRDEPGPARGWAEVAIRGRDGDRVHQGAEPGQPPVLTISTASRIATQTTRAIVASTVLIDRDAVADRDLTQVADYAAMRALTGARAVADHIGDSVLNAFTPGRDGTAPMQMTAFDRTYLKAYYDGPADRPWSIARQSIIASVAQPQPATSARTE